MSNPNVLDNVLLTAVSGNIEWGVEGFQVDPSFFEFFPEPDKYRARTVRFDERQAGDIEYGLIEVITQTGQSIKVVPASPVDSVPGGGSINAAYVAQRLGVSSVGAVIPIGNGRRSERFLDLLQGKEIFTVPASGTAATLTLRTDRGSYLICRKPEILPLSEEIKNQLKSAKPLVLMLMGTKPTDLEVAEHLCLSRARFRTLVPNKALLEDPANRTHLENLIRQSHIFSCNEKEAAVFMGQKGFNWETDSDRFLSLADFGENAMVIVTLSEKGAVLLKSSNNHEPKHFPAISIPSERVLDTSGPGDTLITGVVHSRFLLGNEELAPEVCLKYGMYLAAKKVMARGPWRGIPDEAQRKSALAKIIQGDWPLKV